MSVGQFLLCMITAPPPLQPLKTIRPALANDTWQKMLERSGTQATLISAGFMFLVEARVEALAPYISAAAEEENARVAAALIDNAPEPCARQESDAAEHGGQFG